jgi:Helix-turn-helix domain
MTNINDSRLPVKTTKEPDRSITLLDKWKFMLGLSADRRMNGTDLRCATIIADHFNVGRGYAWPSYAVISSRSGLCRRSIANSVAKLDRLGIILVVSGGNGRANRYYPVWKVSAHDEPAEITGSHDANGRETCTGAASDTGRERCTTPVTKAALPPSRNVHSIPLTPVASSEGGSGIPAAGGAALAGGSLRPRGGGPGKNGFADFWNSYPKREGHASAKKEYDKAIAAGVTAETLISKARQYAEAKADIDAKWLKMPANWLKEECWLEDPRPRPPREPRPAPMAKPAAKRQKLAPAKSKQHEPIVNSAKPVVNRQRALTDKRHASVKASSLAKTARERKPKWAELIPEFIRPGATVVFAGTNQLVRVVGYGTNRFVRIEERDGARAEVHYRALSLPAPKPTAEMAEPPKALPSAVAQSFMATKPTEPPTSQPGIGREAIAAEPKPAPPRPRLAHRVWDEKYGLGRVVLGSESEDGVEVWLDCQMEVFFQNPVDLKLFSVSHPEHGRGRVMAVGGAEYVGHNDLDPVTDEELAELADGQLLVHFYRCGKRRVNVAEVSTTKLCDAVAKSAARRRQPLPFADTSSMLRLHAEGSCAFDVERVLQNYFSVEHSSDIPAEVLAGLLTRIGLDEKGIAAIRTELSRKPVARAAPPPMKAPWFEIGATVRREEHERGCVVLGSESLADNDGKVLIQFEDVPHVSAHPPYPVAADTKRDPAEPITSAPAVSVSLATKSGTETKALDSVIASALGQMDKPFTPGAIAAEAPNPLENAEREAAIDAIMKQLE